MIPAMIASLRHFLGWMVSAFRSREDLVLENLALRRQLLALHAQQPRRRLTALHKLFRVALRTFWSGWTKPLILVTPRTVVNWHHAAFRLYWAWVSKVRKVGGRKRVGKEVRALIFRMVCGVEMWRGGVGAAYLLPALSLAGASLASPCFRFHIPLIEPDVRICRIRLSEKTHAIAVAIACDAVCNFWKQLGSCQAHRQSPFPSSLRVSAFN